MCTRQAPAVHRPPQARLMQRRATRLDSFAPHMVTRNARFTVTDRDVSHALSFAYIPSHVQSRAATGKIVRRPPQNRRTECCAQTLSPFGFLRQPIPPHLVLLHRILAYSPSPTNVGHFRNCSIGGVASIIKAANLAWKRAVKCQTTIEVPNHTRLVSCTRNTIFGSHVSTIFVAPLYYRALQSSEPVVTLSSHHHPSS